MMSLLSHLKLLTSFYTVAMATSFGFVRTSMGPVFRRSCQEKRTYVAFRSSGVSCASPYSTLVRQVAFIPTRTNRAMSTPLQMTESASNYYQSAVSLAQLSTNSNHSYPDWWPSGAEERSYITLMDHIAHFVVPDDVTTLKPNGGAPTCEEVIQLVLDVVNQKNSTIPSNESIIKRQLRLDEWMEGEQVSNSTSILDPGYRHDPSTLPEPTHNKANLSPMELLALGSVWYLPASAAPPNVDRFDASNGIKPRRLTVGDSNITLCGGDYLRVHFDPRRYCEANKWNWGCKSGQVDGRPGVIVARDDEIGYMIVDKPSNVPVHARVDNLLENVASSVGRVIWEERSHSLVSDASNVGASTQETQLRLKKRNKRKQKMEQLVYVATPQRLDQNTTGLLVVATKKSFAAYFAKLLRTKTAGQLTSWRNGTLADAASSSCGIHKSYKCLVCIMQSSVSMVATVEALQTYARDCTIIRHYLEPSMKSRKVFLTDVPEGVENPDSWAECLLRITSVNNVSTVVGNKPSEELAKALWAEYGKPKQCIGVAELEVELITGRTHQIRGQFAALGLPLVGDAQYGGAIPLSPINPEKTTGSFVDSEKLALQCSALEFLGPRDPDEKSQNSDNDLRRSDQWLSFRLHRAFWNRFLEKYNTDASDLSPQDATSSSTDISLVREASEQQSQHLTEDAALPQRVSLRRGCNKYVIIKAKLGGNEVLFVRSASPEECGGPYHANVAEELLLQLTGAGYNASVVGGGRIDYIETDDLSHAHVFGFSYGFGKGDHKLVASLIEANTGIVATFDNSDGLY